MNYYGAGGDKSGLYPSPNFPGASFGLPQQAGIPAAHQQPTGLTPGHGLSPGPAHSLTPGLSPGPAPSLAHGHSLTSGHGLNLGPAHPQQNGISPPTSTPGFPSAGTTQSYSAFPGMPHGQPVYRTTGYSLPSGYPASMTGIPNGTSGLGGMGSYYSSAYHPVTTLPYSTLQPIPQATPSIPSIASLPSVPAVPQIPSIQPSQAGYPAGNRQYQLSQAYMSADPLASKQPTYQIGSNPLMPGVVTSPSMQGVPHGYPTASAMPHGIGYPSSAMPTNPYPGMSGIRISPHTGTPPYGHGF